MLSASLHASDYRLFTQRGEPARHKSLFGSDPQIPFFLQHHYLSQVLQLISEIAYLETAQNPAFSVN